MLIKNERSGEKIEMGTPRESIESCPDIQTDRRLFFAFFNHSRMNFAVCNNYEVFTQDESYDHRKRIEKITDGH